MKRGRPPKSAATKKPDKKEVQKSTIKKPPRQGAVKAKRAAGVNQAALFATGLGQLIGTVSQTAIILNTHLSKIATVLELQMCQVTGQTPFLPKDSGKTAEKPSNAQVTDDPTGSH